MKRELTVDGQPYRVEVENSSLRSPFTVKINDKLVNVVLEEEPASQKQFSIKVDGKPYTVELPRISSQAPFLVKVEDRMFKVELKSTFKQQIAVQSPQASIVIPRATKKTAEEGVVTAPMAGKIIEVKVKKGDSVKAGDVLCTLEAMKMENEVAAPRNGVVREVLVQEGNIVNADDILVVIK